MTRGVQTQLTEEALRGFVAQMEDLLRAGRAESRPDPLGSFPRSVQMSKADAVEIAEFGVALADAYLAQQAKVRDALAGWETRDAGDGLSVVERGTADDLQAITGPIPYERACEIEEWIEILRAGLVSVGSPETRET